MGGTATTHTWETAALTAALASQGDQDLELDGLRLHSASWTPPAQPGRSVLLVHGLTAHSRAWAAIGPALAAGGDAALAPDLRGRGRGDKPPHGYGIAQHAADLLALCDALGLRTIHLVGH